MIHYDRHDFFVKEMSERVKSFSYTVVQEARKEGSEMKMRRLFVMVLAAAACTACFARGGLCGGGGFRGGFHGGGFHGGFRGCGPRIGFHHGGYHHGGWGHRGRGWGLGGFTAGVVAGSLARGWYGGYGWYGSEDRVKAERRHVRSDGSRIACKGERDNGDGVGIECGRDIEDQG